MKARTLALLAISSFALASCGNAAEEEAKRLGFSSVSEMEDVHSKGWHTNAQYLADETERAKRLGFVNVDELHDAESDGIMDPIAYRKHKAQEEAQSVADEADKTPAAQGTSSSAPSPSSANSSKPRQVAASASSCMKLASSTQQFADEIGVSIGVNPSRIEIVGGEYSGSGEICTVTIQSPVGTMKCNSGPIYTDDGGSTTYAAAPGLGVNNSCQKVR